MGAVPIELEARHLDGPGGYAREMTPERAQLSANCSRRTSPPRTP